jgi:hypothetical protein
VTFATDIALKTKVKITSSGQGQATVSSTSEHHEIGVVVEMVDSVYSYMPVAHDSLSSALTL